MDKSIILTKFYKTGLSSQKDIQSKNYNKYIIFSLKNWIHLWIKDILFDRVLIDDVEIPSGDTTTLGIQFIDINDDTKIILSDEFYKIISEKISNFDINKFNWFPIISHRYELTTDEGVILPKIWVKQMINFISINPNYQPYIDSEGLLVNLSSNPDYFNLTSLLSSEIRKKLISMYITGFIFRPNNDMIKRWKLKPHDIIGSNRQYESITNYAATEIDRVTAYDNLLYKADLNSLFGKIPIKGYYYVTDFLIYRIKGEIDLAIEIKLNLLDKHNLAIIFRGSNINIEEYLFDDDGIIFNKGGSDYDTMKKYIELVTNYNINKEYNFNVNIGILKAAFIDEFKDFKDDIIYKEDDQERPYTVSFLTINSE